VRGIAHGSLLFLHERSSLALLARHETTKGARMSGFRSEKNIFTRRKIVLELSDTDGGAHVDAGLKDDYFALSRDNSLGWFNTDK